MGKYKPGPSKDMMRWYLREERNKGWNRRLSDKWGTLTPPPEVLGGTFTHESMHGHFPSASYRATHCDVCDKELSADEPVYRLQHMTEACYQITGGNAVVRRMNRIATKVLDDLFVGTTERDRTELKRLLNTIKTNAAAIGEHNGSS